MAGGQCTFVGESKGSVSTMEGVCVAGMRGVAVSCLMLASQNSPPRSFVTTSNKLDVQEGQPVWEARVGATLAGDSMVLAEEINRELALV